MVIVSFAMAAPVLCDGEAASQLLEDARIPAERVPITQPNLLPGLARSTTDPELSTALDDLCELGGERLSLAEAESWESAGWSAYSFVLTRSTTTECSLEQDAVVLSVGVGSGSPTYSLRSGRTHSSTPFGACEGKATYRREELIDGAGTPVRLVLQTTFEGEEVVHSRVVVRRATQDGWHEQLLLEPAPDRLLDPDGGGPLLSLAGADADPWIVAHADRTTGETCRAVAGQTVWRWEAEERSWKAIEGRGALGRLADIGAWRLAGQDGWFLIVAQDNESDRTLLQARMRRLQKRHDDPLSIRESALFPGMNSGFFIVSPDPWPTEEEADSARKKAGRRTGVYVKQGWTALDGCASSR